MKNKKLQALLDYLEVDLDVNPSEEQKQEFITRTKKHIALVNKYGAKIDRDFSNHDASKLTSLLDGYCFYTKPKDELTEAERSAMDAVTLLHITQSPHHPEYWTDSDLTGFTRANPIPNGVIDVRHMPEEYIEEMVCDWAAMGEEFGNTALEWFHLVNGSRWLFTPEQQKFILDTIEKVEG